MKRNPLYREIVKGLDWKLDTSNHSQSDYKKLPKKPRAYLLIASTGNNGITENEILTDWDITRILDQHPNKAT